MLWRYNPRPLRHQQKFIPWLELYCRYDHVTKVWFGTSSISMIEETLTLGRAVLHQCGKRVETKSQNVLVANSYVCKSYREKTGWGLFAPS